jgi:hypothetical protein
MTMALKKANMNVPEQQTTAAPVQQTTAAPVQQAPATTAPVVEPAVEIQTAAEVAAEVQQTVAAAPAAPAPAVVQPKPVGTIVGIDSRLLIPVGGKEPPLWDDLENAYTADYGELPRLKASNGGLSDDQDKYGEFIGLQILGWNRLWIVSPGADEAPGEVVGYSHDGEYLDDGSGTSVKEHLDKLKLNWDKAAVKEYHEVVGILLTSEKPTAKKGKMVQLQLSPTSVSAFNSYRKQGPINKRLGLIPDGFEHVVRINAEVAKNKQSKEWTKMVFAPPVFG